MWSEKRKRERERDREREREGRGEERRQGAASLEKLTERGQEVRRKREGRPACLGVKGEIGSGRSLSFKGTGYLGDREGLQNDNISP